MTTGEKIRQIRLLKKFSQDNMASMLGISRLAYSDIERGKTNVSDSRLQEIAEKLEVTKSHIESFGERVAVFF